MTQTYVAVRGSAVPIKAGQCFNLSYNKMPGEKDRYRALVDFDLIEEASKAGIDLWRTGASATDQARAALTIAGHLVTNKLAELASKNKQTH